MSPTIEQIAEKYEEKLSHCDFHMWPIITTTGRTVAGEIIFQAITEATAVKDAEIVGLRKDKERLLNVLEHCALEPNEQPTKQYLVARMVVKEYRDQTKHS